MQPFEKYTNGVILMYIFMLNSNPQLTRYCTGRVWTDQQLEEPETRFVVAGFDGVDEEEHHEAVEDQGVDLHGDVDVLRKQAGEDAETPQHTQEPCDLQQKRKQGGMKTKSVRGENPGVRWFETCFAQSDLKQVLVREVVSRIDLKDEDMVDAGLSPSIRVDAQEEDKLDQQETAPIDAHHRPHVLKTHKHDT